ASNVVVRNTTISRPQGSQPASSGPVHNPPYAGIEVASSSNRNSLVQIEDSHIDGFDIGIGFNLTYNKALVQNNVVTRNATADVRTIWAGIDSSQYPVVDLGGGSLGSVGGN